MLPAFDQFEPNWSKERARCPDSSAALRGWCWISSLLFVGCGYMVGPAYQSEYRTVEVPIFQSDSNRRGIEFQLTEAVHKEIKKRPHLRLVNGAGADTRLIGRIVGIRKNVLGESDNDDPRELQLSLAVEVTWLDLQGRRPIIDDTVQLQAQAEFAPEVGQSFATGRQQAIEQLARKIVDLTEMPW